MKKLLLVAMSALALVGMAGCSQGESKSDWTKEEKALMSGKKDGYCCFNLPFYKAKFTVEADEDLGVIRLESGRKCTEKDLDAYIDLLESKNYEQMEEPCVDFEEIDADAEDFIQFRKENGTYVAHDVAAVGLIDDTLIVYATATYRYMGLDCFSAGWLLPNAIVEGNDYHVEGQLEASDEWFCMLYELEESKFVYPTMEDETGLWMCDEGMYVCPWTLGNPNSESFGYDFLWGFAGGTETERETLISGLEVAGFELDSKTKAYTLSADEGTYYVFVGEYREELVTLQTGEAYAGYTVEYFFIPAE